MSVSTYEQLSSYPLPAYNFRVTVDDKTVSFAAVSGLTRSHETVTYRHGLSWTEGEQLFKFFVPRWTKLELRRGTMPGSAGTKWLYDWLEDDKPRSIQVDMCDANGDVVIRWSIAKALAVRLTGPSLDASSSEVAIESLELEVYGVKVSEEDRKLEEPS